MANWQKHVSIAEATDRYESDVARYGEGKGVELTKERLLKVLAKELPELPGTVTGAFKRAKTERGLNSALDKLWDWADVNLVWVQNF